MNGSLFFVAFGVLSTAAHAASQSKLSHDAPFLGHTLELTIDDAPASQPLALFYSPRRGETRTAWGVLEIERASSQRIAVSAADAQGHATFAIPIPADASLAETEAHFQVLVEDPSSNAGKSLSSGVHVRVLGTRVYTGYYEYGYAHRAGMEIVSAVKEETVARFAYDGAAASRTRPVFRRNYSVGAVLDGANTLVLFDPFFGTVRSRMSFGPCVPVLLTDAAEEHVLVLETSGHITSVDFATGTIMGELSLSSRDAKVWCANDRRTEAYVGVYDGDLLGSSVRRIALSPLVERASISVANGATQQVVSGIAFADRTVVATSAFVQWNPHVGYEVVGALTRIDTSGPQVSTTVEIDNGWKLYSPLLSPVMDRIVTWASRPNLYAFPSYEVHTTALSHAAPLQEITPPSTPPLNVWAMVAQDSGVWVAGSGSYGVLSPESGWVLFLELSDLTWTIHPPFPAQHSWSPPPHDIATARDAYVDRVYAALPRTFAPNDRTPQAPELLAIDPRGGEPRHIALQHSPETVRVVEVP